MAMANTNAEYKSKPRLERFWIWYLRFAISMGCAWSSPHPKSEVLDRNPPRSQQSPYETSITRCVQVKLPDKKELRQLQRGNPQCVGRFVKGREAWRLEEESNQECKGRVKGLTL